MGTIDIRRLGYGGVSYPYSRERHTLTLTQVQDEIWELFLQQEDRVLKGQNLNEQARELCDYFDGEGAALSSSCAKRLIRGARKESLLVPDEEGGVRTLFDNERHELNKRRQKARRGATSNTAPVYRNDARAAVAA